MPGLTSALLSMCMGLYSCSTCLHMATLHMVGQPVCEYSECEPCVRQAQLQGATETASDVHVA